MILPEHEMTGLMDGAALGPISSPVASKPRAAERDEGARNKAFGLAFRPFL